MENLEISKDKVINKAYLVGELVKEVTHSHIFGGKMFYFFKLRVDSNKSDKSDFIQVFVPEDMISIDNKMTEVGSTLEIQGKLVHSKIEGKHDTVILATSLKEVSKDTPHDNRIIVSGNIYKSYEMVELDDGKVSKNFILKHIDEDDNSRYFTLRVAAWNSLAQDLDSNYKEGDKVIIKARFESRNRKNDKGIDYELHKAVAYIILNGRVD